MLVHSYDSAHSEEEWRVWVAEGGKFGTLAVSASPGEAPIMVPTHFVLLNDKILIHLHKANSAIPYLRTGANVSLSVIGDYAFVPGQWRAKDENDPQDGVPTSYYAAVNFACVPKVIDDAEGIVEILKLTMTEFQPEGGYADLEVGEEPFGHLVSVITGIELHITNVDAKFKYDDHKTIEFREKVIEQLLNRNVAQDVGAASQQRRRLINNRS
jgi:transcriptional regulator